MRTAVLAALIGFGPARAAQAATILVTVENVESSQGEVSVGLCDKGLSKEYCPYSVGRRAEAGKMEFKFENVPPGRYAVASYHDVNSNREFDRTLGIPQEPYALSNDAAKSLVPTLSEAAVAVGDGVTRVTVRLRRFMAQR